MKKTLVILAAGMGSRFGGIKQLEPVGPSGEIISDYNIYNAIKHGFTKIVFIIRREHLQIFEEKIVSKYKDKVEIAFAFQELNEIYPEYKIPETRTKMLGTVHALLCAKNVIDGTFGILNADDFYGEKALESASAFMDISLNEDTHLTINYPLKNVTSGALEVKRGLCYKDNEGNLNNVLESVIKEENGKYIAKELDKEELFEVDGNMGCSMNFFVYKTSIFKHLEEYYLEFLKNINDTNECLLSIFLNEYIKKEKIKLFEVITDSKWMGITYKEDLEGFKSEINKMIEAGEYPRNLWEN